MPPLVTGPDETCSTVGGLPAVACPAPEPAVYTVPVEAGWNLPLFAGHPAPLLALGALLDDVTPAVPVPLAIELGYSLIGVTPDSIPPDNTWSVFTEAEVSSGPLGLAIPIALATSPQLLGLPVWFRIRTVDANGCETRIHAWFPEGLPTSWDVPETPVIVYVGFDLDAAYDFTVMAPPAADEAGPTTVIPIEVTPDCPPPRLAVAVAPACEFPVQIDQTVEVTVETSEEGPLFVEVVNPAARSVAEVVPVQAIDSAGQPGTTENFAEGWAQIIVSGYGPASSFGRLMFEGVEIPIPRNPDHPTSLFGPYVLDAPAGLLGPAGSVQVWTDSAPDEIKLNLAVLYPPS